MSINLVSERDLTRQRANPRCGELRTTVITVWQCGDGDCGCSQVRVEELHDNPLFRGATWTVELADGEYFTDNEGTPEKWAVDIEAARLAFPHAEDLTAAARGPRTGGGE